MVTSGVQRHLRSLLMAPRAELLRTNAGIATGTALSRLTGYGRVLALAYLMQIGTGAGDKGSALSAAYLLANTTPNIVYDLILGGVLSATLVPLFTEYFEHDDDEAVNSIVMSSIIVLALLTTFATLAAPLIIRFYTALRLDPAVDAHLYRSVSTTLAYYFLPQIFFYGLSAIGTAFLNARRRFIAAAWAPVVNNVVTIVLLLAARAVISEAPSLELVRSSAPFRYLLGLGATAGVAAMALVLLPSIAQTGFRFHFAINLRHRAIRKLLRLSGWTAGYVVANQIAFLIITQLAQRSTGGFSAYVTMYTFFQLPYGLLAVTLMTTVGPELARDMAHRNRSSFRERVRDGVWWIVLLMLPATVIMMAFSTSVARLAGSFGNISSSPGTLAAFSFGLIGFSIYMFIMRGFYAMHNTKTPFVINLIENLLNIVVALLLVQHFGVKGLAWSFSIAYMLSAAFAYWVLSNWSRGLDGVLLVPRLVRLAGAALLTIAAAIAARSHVNGHGFTLILRLAFGSIVVLVVYAISIYALRVSDKFTTPTRVKGPPLRGALRDHRDE